MTADVPQWGQVYSVQGILRLPYAEIEEPFTGYFDATNKRSRVDYYGGRFGFTETWILVG